MTSTFKSYEDYRMITDKTSLNYQLVQSMTVGMDGLLYLDGYIGIALSSQYGGVGTKYRITLASGKQFKAIKVDEKQEQHLTNNCTDMSGAMIEFVVDETLLSDEVRTHGSVNVLLDGEIISIEKEN